MSVILVEYKKWIKNILQVVHANSLHEFLLTPVLASVIGICHYPFSTEANMQRGGKGQIVKYGALGPSEGFPSLIETLYY